MNKTYVLPQKIEERTIAITDVRAVAGDSAFLIDDGETAVLYDTGFSFTCAAVIENIRQVIGNRPIDYILLTFLKKAEASAKEMAQTIETLFLCEKTKEEIFAFLAQRDYKEHVRPVYPYEAFRVNTQIMIELVIRGLAAGAQDGQENKQIGW